VIAGFDRRVLRKMSDSFFNNESLFAIFIGIMNYEQCHEVRAYEARVRNLEEPNLVP